MSAPTRTEKAFQDGVSATDSEDRIRAEAARIAAIGNSGYRTGLYPVNRPMIDHWTSALDSYRPGPLMTPQYTDDAPRWRHRR